MISRQGALGGILCIGLALGTGSALAQDSDGDGVQDYFDRFPCDASAAGEAFVPAQGAHALMLFEDQWPAQGDLDFNDAVLAYHFHFRTTAEGLVSSLRVVVDPLAVGGVYDNGLGLHLPVARGAVESVTRSIAGGPATPLAPSTADAELTVRVLDNLRTAFGGAADQINSLTTQPAIDGQVIELEVRFTTPIALDTAGAPYDLFLVRTNDAGHEIHRPEFGGTAQMNQSMFGASDDRSAPGRWFVDSRNLPFVLLMPETSEYPSEASDIAALFPDVLTFASSGGASAKDYYQSIVVAQHAYAPSTGTAPAPQLPGAAPADRACLPQSPASCMAILQSGQSVGDGVYTIDPDGSGPLAPVATYCDMTTDGGGWTLLAKTVRTGMSTSEMDVIRRGTWADYTQAGYGDPAASSRLYWMPLAAWHELTDRFPTNEWQIRDSARQLDHDNLRIEDAAKKYAITWANCGADFMLEGNSNCFQTSGSQIFGQAFTTHDQDNDTWGNNCARNNVGFNGGFWYSNCWQTSMLHANGNLYSWYSNASQSVQYVEHWFREERIQEPEGRTCLEVLRSGGSRGDGIYWLDPNGSAAGGPYRVYCDMTNGGYMLLARTHTRDLTASDRIAPQRGTWATYTRAGYGAPDAGSPLYWMPLQAWHEFTAAFPSNAFWIQDTQRDLRHFDFTVSDEAGGYALDWSSCGSDWMFEGEGSNCLQTNYSDHRNFRNQAFTTWDRDQDRWGSNCASGNVGYNGGFWYTNCGQISTLHNNGSLYSWYNNVSTGVNRMNVWWRESETRSLTSAGADCQSILQAGGSTGDGVYVIDPDGAGGRAPFEVYCDMTTMGGGWTVIANNDNADVEPLGCIAGIATSDEQACGEPGVDRDFAVPAYGLGFSEIVWAARGAGATPSSYQYMRFNASQVVPSTNTWWLTANHFNQPIPDWAGAPLIQCTYYSSRLTAVGNTLAAGSADYGNSRPVTVFADAANRGMMSFTEFNPWSATQATMSGLDDFQDGRGCGDSWVPKSDRGASTFVMIR